MKSTSLTVAILTVVSLALEASVAIVTTVYYSILSPLLPSVFPTYNFVSHKDGYYRLCDSLDFWAVLVILLAVSLVLVVFDNERREYMIEKTDGFYTVADGARIYYSRYCRDDVIAAAIAPLLMSGLLHLRLVELPRQIAGIVELLVAPIDAVMIVLGDVSPALGAPLAYFVMFTATAVFRLAFGILGIKKWRAEWLSDTGVV